jgi:hypothetical protein
MMLPASSSATALDSASLTPKSRAIRAAAARICPRRSHPNAGATNRSIVLTTTAGLILANHRSG